MSVFSNISLGGNKKDKSEQENAANKELQRLRRVDLLELLIDQIKENEEQSAKVKELSDLTDRLKAKLDQKDEQIERLKGKLDVKDAQIEKLQTRYRALAKIGGLSEALNQYEVEELAFERYLDEFGKNDESAGYGLDFGALLQGGADGGLASQVPEVIKDPTDQPSDED